MSVQPTPTSQADNAGASPAGQFVAQGRPVTLRAMLAYRTCDRLSEGLVYFMVVFSPWAFGTSSTQPWSVWVMNVAGYTLGTLLFVKLAIRWRSGYQPARWCDAAGGLATSEAPASNGAARCLTASLAFLTSAILLYCLVAALNARATYNPLRMDFTYHTHLNWLPHSYDSNRTWQIFFNYLALACSFWAVRDWLLGKSAGEERAARNHTSSHRRVSYFPARLRRLLWLLSLNGALLGAQGVAQRFSDSGKLLWLVEPRVNKTVDSQFGPFAYRANAAQYLNLVWPAALGLWWRLRREGRQRSGALGRFRRFAPHALLVCVLLMAACPIISTSRGGAIIAVGSMIVAAAILLLAMRRRHPLVKFGVILFFGAAFSVGMYLGWDKLADRMIDLGEGYRYREAMYQTARDIARDYPLFGTGPGTFEPVYQLYRSSPEQYWPAQLHNDWLETRLTFGWFGSALIALAFVTMLARWLAPGGMHGGWRFTSLLWLALAGCLVHARFDFPLQMYSILFLFLLHCAILFTLSRQRTAD